MEPNTKISKKTSSAEIVASIDDLLTEIFLRFPPKPLVRFKLVSKHWNSVISDPKFHFLRNQNPNPAVGLIFQIPGIRSCTNPRNASKSKPTYAYVFSLEKSPSPQIRTLKYINPWPCIALNSCNGLLLCRSSSILYHQIRFYICNPTTNKYSTLPQTTEMSLCGAYLAFDPSRSPHYKVVCVRRLFDTTSYWYQFEVYSSETGCWRKCGEPFTTGVNFYRGVYWNGAIHWISFTKTGKSLYFNPDDDDDDDQMPQVMPTPPILKDYYLTHNCNYLGESGGHLHFIDEYTAVSEFNVYEMRRDYSEWFVKYRVDCSCIVDRLFSMCTLVRGKKEGGSFLILRIGGRLIRHNLVHKTCETICELEGAAQFEHCYSSSPEDKDIPLQYIESLCSV